MALGADAQEVQQPPISMTEVVRGAQGSENETTAGVPI
jgi:hypothetical protein